MTHLNHNLCFQRIHLPSNFTYKFSVYWSTYTETIDYFIYKHTPVCIICICIILSPNLVSITSKRYHPGRITPKAGPAGILQFLFHSLLPFILRTGSSRTGFIFLLLPSDRGTWLQWLQWLHWRQMDPTIPWSIWDIIKDIDPMTLWTTTKKQGQLGSSLPKTKLHTEWSIHPGCFGRPHQFSPVPFSCAVMEDDEHVFLIYQYLFTKFQAVCQEFPEAHFTCTYPKAKSNIGPTRVRTGFRLPTFNTSMPLDLVFKQRANRQWSLRCAGVVPVFFLFEDYCK